MNCVLYEYKYLPEPVKLMAKSVQDHLDESLNITYTVYDKDSTNLSYPYSKSRVWMMCQEGKVLAVCHSHLVNLKYLKNNLVQEISPLSCKCVLPHKNKSMVCLITDSAEPLNMKYWNECTPVKDIESEIMKAYMVEEQERFQLETAEEFCFEEID